MNGLHDVLQSATRKLRIGVKEEKDFAGSGPRRLIEFTTTNLITLTYDHLGSAGMARRIDRGVGVGIVLARRNEDRYGMAHNGDGTLRSKMHCYILAGGRSSRMGRPKEEVNFRGATFLQRVLTAASKAFDGVIGVTREVKGSLSGLPSIQDEQHEGTAPIFGILRALRHAESLGDRRIWILALDYPLVSPQVLRFLRQEFEAGDNEMLVPVAEGIEQVLCAGYATALIGRLEGRISRGDYSLRPLMEECRSRVVDEEIIQARFGVRSLWNVNTPEDLERLHREDGQADAS